MTPINEKQREVLLECSRHIQFQVSSFIIHQRQLNLSDNVVCQILGSSNTATNCLLLIKEIRTQEQFVGIYKVAIKLKNYIVASLLHPHVPSEHHDDEMLKMMD